MTNPTIKLLQKHDRLYAQGKTQISDAKYDKMRKAAQKLFSNDPYFQKVGAKLTSKNDKRIEVKLPFFMGSLHKKRPNEISVWCQKLPSYYDYVLTPKLNGIALLLEYEDGKLIKAYTRGDNGITGFDVTRGVKHIPSVKAAITAKAKHSPFKGTLFVRGECVINQTLFKKQFAKKVGGKYKNARTFVAGVINTLKVTPETIQALKTMKFVAYGMHRVLKDKPIYHEHKLSELLQLNFYGFQTTLFVSDAANRWWDDFDGKFQHLLPKDYPSKLLKLLIASKIYFANHSTLTAEMLAEQVKASKADKYIDIDQDGMVLEIGLHKYRKTLGFNDPRPSHSFAVKLEAKDQETLIGVVKEVIWEETFRRLFKPVVVLKKKLDFDGIEVERISAHNAAFVKKHKLQPGMKVKVIHSGSVIPRLLGAA